MNRPTRISLVVVLALLLPGIAAAQRLIYVNAAATGAGGGSSWPDAYSHLQDALAAAESGDELWVAEGTYQPDQGAGMTPGNRQAVFVMKDGVALYGGFAGDEQQLKDREWVVHPTILSGDLLQNDDEVLEVENPLRSDNSLIVVHSDTVEPVVLDGFTIRGANANEAEREGGWGLVIAQSQYFSGLYTFSNLIIELNTGEGGAAISGAGLRSTMNPVLFRRVVFKNNRGGEDSSGGGLSVFSSYVRLEDVDFVDNRASVGGALYGAMAEIEWKRGSSVGNAARAWGGAVHMSGENNSHLEGANIFFIGNRAEQFDGGAISLDEASLHLVNSVFSENSAATKGGALLVTASSALLSNCTLVGNHAETGGGAVYNFATTDTLRIDNSILWENTSTMGPKDIYNDVAKTTRVRNSILGEALTPGVIDGGGILFDDPLFMDIDGPDDISGTQDDDFRLSADSPAIDVGQNALLLADRLDLDGNGNFGELLPADLDGNRRVFAARGGGTVADMGAYEYGAPAVPTPVEENGILRAPTVNIELFPNPVENRVNVLLDWPEDTIQAELQVVVYDVLGRVLRRISIAQGNDQGTLEIELGGDIVNGVYIVSIQSKTFVVNKALVVAK